MLLHGTDPVFPCLSYRIRAATWTRIDWCVCLTGLRSPNVIVVFCFFWFGQAHQSTQQQLRYQLISSMAHQWTATDSQTFEAVDDPGSHNCPYLAGVVKTALQAMAGQLLLPPMRVDNMHLLVRVAFPGTESTPLFVRFWQSRWVFTRYD